MYIYIYYIILHICIYIYIFALQMYPVHPIHVPVTNKRNMPKRRELYDRIESTSWHCIPTFQAFDARAWVHGYLTKCGWMQISHCDPFWPWKVHLRQLRDLSDMVRSFILNQLNIWTSWFACWFTYFETSEGSLSSTWSISRPTQSGELQVLR